MSAELTAEHIDDRLSGVSPPLAGLFADTVRLHRPLQDLHTSYRAAAPFPHVVIDDLFTPRVLDPLVTEMSGMGDAQWRTVETRSRERIRRMHPGAKLGPAGAQLVNLVHSASFLYLLSEITGIWQLLPDPYLQGAGYAAMKRGDFFKIHSDRNVAYDTGLTRRLVMIVFLNREWDPKYRGQLELWNHEATRCDVSVEPLYNRTILFEVADPNYHGVPTPLECPVDRSRQSFMVYYHTVGVDGKTAVRPHTSVFAHNAKPEPRRPFRELALAVTPPVVAKAARKLASLVGIHEAA
jgi:hypothetical protein